MGYLERENLQSMLTNYQSMTMARLVDLLAYHTEKYTQLLADRQFNEEYEKSKEAIQQIQAAIKVRESTNITIQLKEEE